MDIFLLFLTSTMMSAFFAVFFILGTLYERKRTKDEGVSVEDPDALERIIKYMTYDGRSDR